VTGREIRATRIYTMFRFSLDRLKELLVERYGWVHASRIFAQDALGCARNRFPEEMGL